MGDQHDSIDSLSDVEDSTSKQPPFRRVAENGQLWLWDREAFKTVGPFASCAEAIAYMDSRLSGNPVDRAFPG